MGKTGVFLQLGYELWRLVGRPEHTSPQISNFLFESAEEIEVEKSDDDEIHDEIRELREIDSKYQEEYPNFDFIKTLPFFKKLQISKKYGDPNDEEILNLYRSGNRPRSESDMEMVRKADATPQLTLPRRTKILTKFPSRTLTKAVNIDKENLNQIREERFEKKSIPMEEFPGGYLLLNRETKDHKWRFLREFPNISRKLAYPPILVPSCGRQSSGLFDLRAAMEGRTNYVEIVIIRQNEEREYLEHLLSDNNIDIFVMDGSTPHTVGAARWTAKKLAEIITNKGCSSKFCLVMDDDILYWRAVTLINDPHPPFDDLEPSDERSQRTDISLLKVMEYCSNDNIKKHQLHKFSIIGFSIGGHKGDDRLRLAFGRQHVFAAIFLNINKLCRVDYNKEQMAMEDVDFNLRTDSDGGVLVKCRRFKAGVDRTIKEGGVTVEVRKSSARKNKTKSLGQKMLQLGWLKPFLAWKTKWREKMLDVNLEEKKELPEFFEWITDIHRKEDDQSSSLANEMNRIFIDEDLNFSERIERIIKRIENKEREEMLTHRPLQINPLRGTSSSPRPGTSSDMLPLGVTQKRPADNRINSLEKKKKKEQRPSSKL